jgi:vancomycin permeability regulator SanA
MKAMVILGNRLLSDQVPAELKGRLDLALSLLEKEEVQLIIPTGGKTNRDIDKSESSAMAEYLTGSGVDPRIILLEEKAMDTIGNAVFTRIALDSRGECSEVIVVTSCYHVRRSKFIFEKALGDRYSLDFSHCSENVRPKGDDSALMSKAEGFFNGISPADVDTMVRKLYSLYTLNRRE